MQQMFREEGMACSNDSDVTKYSGKKAWHIQMKADICVSSFKERVDVPPHHCLLARDFSVLIG
jgi:hypothetical protein